MSSDTDGLADGAPPNLAAIELHDSILGSLTVGTNGDAVIHFEHLNVFIRTAVDRYQVWSYRADLLLQGLEQLSVEKMLGSADYISDGGIVDVDGHRLELSAPFVWTGDVKVEVLFSSLAKLSARVSRVRLSLVTPLRMLEEWRGPLG